MHVIEINYKNIRTGGISEHIRYDFINYIIIIIVVIIVIINILLLLSLSLSLLVSLL